MIRFFPALILAMALALPASGQGLDASTRENLGQGLEALGIEETELGFYKQWATDSFFRLKAIDFLLDNPLEVAGYVDSFAQQFRARARDPFALACAQWRETDVRLSASDTSGLGRSIRNRARREAQGGGILPRPVEEAVSLVLAGLREAKPHLDRATAGLSERELDILLGELPGFWEEDDSTRPKPEGVLQREFGREYDTTIEVKAETVLAYVRKLDRRELALAGLAVAYAAREAEAVLGQQFMFAHEGATTRVPGMDGLAFWTEETDFGRVVVGGDGYNHYHGDFCLIIDVAGNDRYSGRAGAAVGILGNPFAVSIDLGGSDLYDSELLFSQGAAAFGAGVLIDVAGDDVYRAQNYAQGAAVFGTGILCDRAGRDIYDAGSFVQAAGMFGTGLLCDAEGNDQYRGTYYCQAYSSVWGYGLLVEESGNDCYWAGGEHLHEPLLPHEYQSFAQGFSIGWRPDASGGIGFLCDVEGNDFYNAEVYAQATSYWYSLGALWDGDGYDHYLAAQYSQGAGIHLAVGCLIDNKGNDSYYSRLGPSQGEGHDFSVGVLVDRAGNDVYHASGGQGVALTNSVGLFADVTGNDVYSGTEDLALAGGRPARGFASLGNFVDLAGRDRYTAGSSGADLTAWTNGTYGAGADLSQEPVPGDEADEGDTLVSESDSLELPVDSLFKYASMWEVGNARAKVKQARRQLHALGGEAIAWVVENKADTKDGLESRAIELLVKEHPDTAKPYLYRVLRDDRFRARNNAAYWLGKLEDKARDAVDSLLLALKAKRISPRRAVSSLGDIGDTTVVPRILYLLKDEYEPSRVVTCEALGKLKTRTAIPSLIAALSDRLFTVRSGAEDALIKTGRPVLGPLLYAALTLRPPALGHALRVLRRVADSLDPVADLEPRVQVRKVVVPLLRHDAPFVRMTAVEACAPLLDEPLKRELEDARAIETNRFVLAAFEEVLSE